MTKPQLLAISPFTLAEFLVDVPAALTERFTLELPGGWPATVVEVMRTAADRVVASGASETIIYGHSINAALALAAATGPCRAVIAVSAPHRVPLDRAMRQANWDTNAEPERKARAAAIEAQYEAAADDEKLGLWQQFNGLRSVYDLDAAPTGEDRLTKEVMGWVMSITQSGSEVDWAALHDQISVPVFLALGAYDFNTPASPWLTEPTRPGWTVEIFERSSHSPPTEQPVEFIEALDRWLGAL